MGDKSSGFLDDMEFESQLDEMEKRGPTAVAIFTARQIHQMCKMCQRHERDINNLKKVYPNKKDSLISGAGGGVATTGIAAIIYYFGKLLNIWN